MKTGNICHNHKMWEMRRKKKPLLLFLLSEKCRDGKNRQRHLLLSPFLGRWISQKKGCCSILAKIGLAHSCLDNSPPLLCGLRPRSRVEQVQLGRRAQIDRVSPGRARDARGHPDRSCDGSQAFPESLSGPELWLDRINTLNFPPEGREMRGSHGRSLRSVDFYRDELCCRHFSAGDH